MDTEIRYLEPEQHTIAQFLLDIGVGEEYRGDDPDFENGFDNEPCRKFIADLEAFDIWEEIFGKTFDEVREIDLCDDEQWEEDFDTICEVVRRALLRKPDFHFVKKGVKEDGTIVEWRL